MPKQKMSAFYVNKTKFKRQVIVQQSEIKIFNYVTPSTRGWEFSSQEIELPNQVMQNDVTVRVINLEIFIGIVLLSYELSFIKCLIKLQVTNWKI